MGAEYPFCCFFMSEYVASIYALGIDIYNQYSYNSKRLNYNYYQRRNIK